MPSTQSKLYFSQRYSFDINSILVYLIVLTGQISGLKCKRVIVVLPLYKSFTVLRKGNMIA